jgi:hypothetical protein
MITPRARAEADWFLRFYREYPQAVSEADYEEWFLQDSRGQPCRRDNLILQAKKHYWQYIWGLRDWRDDPYGWPGGLTMLGLPVRVLIEAFGPHSVYLWAQELFWSWGNWLGSVVPPHIDRDRLMDRLMGRCPVPGCNIWGCDLVAAAALEKEYLGRRPLRADHRTP